MEVDRPEIVAEVRAAFERYEKALGDNDTATLDALFWDDSRTIRFGLGENLYGIEQIRAFRAARSPSGLARRLGGTVITTFGQDFATASTLTQRVDTGRTGRQMQSWARMDDGWRIVAAHVSWLEFEFPS